MRTSKKSTVKKEDKELASLLRKEKALNKLMKEQLKTQEMLIRATPIKPITEPSKKESRDIVLWVLIYIGMLIVFGWLGVIATVCMQQAGKARREGKSDTAYVLAVIFLAVLWFIIILATL